MLESGLLLDLTGSYSNDPGRSRLAQGKEKKINSEHKLLLQINSANKNAQYLNISQYLNPNVGLQIHLKKKNLRNSSISFVIPVSEGKNKYHW